MILAIAYYLFITTLVAYFIILLTLLITLTFIKIKLEPVKGVCKSNARLDGKVALVTGGNQGIGLETARGLASHGATVVIACRDKDKSAKAIADITASTGNKNIEFRHLDLASFSNVRQFAEDFNKAYDRLDILVNNAGCGGYSFSLTKDGVSEVMQINYFGPFLLTNLLLDKLKASKPSRIIIVSSCLHYLGKLHPDEIRFGGDGVLNQFLIYAKSKLCDLLWTKALAKRLPEGVTVNSLHPGAVKTDIFKKLPYVISKTVDILLELFACKTPKEGAQTTLHCCLAEELENVTGKYFMECAEAGYSSLADDDDLVEDVWNNSIKITNFNEPSRSG
ncbi:retinol dehydrogenase 11-like [Helicoverpa armigera]|uniref:retinol dehydrogenase 11-like n=1 Tax=Helicoverpa armigera TaxID=29058 RepID=UPI003082ECD4